MQNIIVVFFELTVLGCPFFAFSFGVVEYSNGVSVSVTTTTAGTCGRRVLPHLSR